MHRVWRWPLVLVIPAAAVFICVDLSFFAANLLKIADGGWIPLTLGLVIFVIMITWRMGVQALRAMLTGLAEPAEQFLQELKDSNVPRVPGTAVFLTRTGDKIPSYICDHVRNMGSLHKTVIILNLSFEEQPRITEDRCRFERLADGLTRATVRYGFIERPDIPATLRASEGLPEGVDMDRAVFFGTRDLVTAAKHSPLVRWRVLLFAFLYRNAVRLIDRFDLPPARTMEITRQLKL
jgi:KUP system potassium uptake protein